MSKLPKKAQLVFQGDMFSVYQWQQKQFDGSMARFEMIKRPYTVVIIPIIGEKICILRERHPHEESFRTSHPMGQVEGSEEPLVAAKRELREEAGLTSEHWELYKQFQPHKRIDWEVYVYFARDCQEVGHQSLDAGEQIEVQYVDFDTYVQLAYDDSFPAPEQRIELMEAVYNKEKYEELKKRFLRASNKS